MSEGIGTVGRDIALVSRGSAILGVKEKGVTRNGEPVDVSSDESGGVRELLNVSKRDEVNITLSGITKDRVLKTEWHSKNRLGPRSLTYPNGDVLAGDFYLASYTETGPFEDAMTFQAELRSSGTITYTAGV